ncbi:Aph-1 protein [Ancylostoma caninum]|uniref:Aph-1 protein n=1 Tax=Ancylostoma caninum TaxID=29170 RepID=A0A368GIS5_ANCCA|nr:Aph-1 protein [Ancylostoma caninum]
MGVWLTIACYLITFSPSAALFCRFVAKDPLRIILFVLGAFFWLASLLLSSFIWLAISMVWDALPLAVACSIILQDAARVFYFWLLKKAQRYVPICYNVELPAIHTKKDGKDESAIGMVLPVRSQVIFFSLAFQLLMYRSCMDETSFSPSNDSQTNDCLGLQVEL